LIRSKMVGEDSGDNVHVWRSFCRAVRTDLREHRSITGASGVVHPVQAIGVDDKEGRVVVVSAEPSARIAAMMQVDVQATIPDAHVIVARPIAFDLGALSRNILGNLGQMRLSLNDVNQLVEQFNIIENEDKRAKFVEHYITKWTSSSVKALQAASLPVISQILAVMQQAGDLDWTDVFDKETQSMDITRLFEFDNLQLDRDRGVCPLPLYELKEDDWELFKSGADADSIEQRLRDLDVLQYFFPSPDQTALGLVERGINKPLALSNAMKQAPALGHPYGEPEIISPADLPNYLDELGALGYVAEGEMGWEITPNGRTVRNAIRIRPREGLFVKIVNRFNLNLGVSPNDFF